ncbi:ACP S-malonyltransferase [Bermanella marisrubri]|uniref:Malonyl CoA-acyl carrier protein transacylase n=1 Tax=Bermanella marisrubri TaxID=207949 RepID=Q1N4V0_9GAMM|nr:ACP S-malonyltransferase [Bermanella marisrubri]EAT13328.1 acyl carrier protein S-malonyltransferase [Oceanobacter sp. RED65] [Bermanella marisrubri]QIZ84088.1 ACP S-malonyltransferase [Bermanella marisrubri]
MSKVAVVFPGQGSQSVGMISDVIAQHAIAKDTLSEANEVLGFDLQTLIESGPADELNSTENTQPALVAVEVALWRALNEKLAADIMAGHSLGEYSALVCAGALSFCDALKLVRRRGQLMQEAVPAGEGGMAAVLGMQDDQVEAICAQLSSYKIVQPANYNGPGQLVIAGHADAVEKAAAQCKEAGAKRAMILPVSGPFHSALMQPAADAFAGFIAEVDIKTPSVPVLQNASIELETDPKRIRSNLVAQIASPVNWTRTVELLAEQGVESIFEVGPGKVLTGLNKRIDKSLSSSVINNSESIANILA